MTNKEKIRLLIAETSADKIDSYYEKLYENLRHFNVKEERHFLWEAILFIIYISSSNIKTASINLGVIQVTDSNLIVKILPVCFTAVLYNSHIIAWQRQNIISAIEIILNHKFNNRIGKFGPTNYLSLVFLPYSISDTFSAILREKREKKEIVITAFLLLPLLLIGLVPYIIAISMVVDLFRYHLNSCIGSVSFAICIWFLIILIHFFYTSIKTQISEFEE